MLIAVIFIGTWFFAVSPRLDAAAETLAQAEEVQSRNELLDMQVIKLRADFQRLDEYREALVEIQREIPPVADLDRVVAEIHAAAVETGSFVVKLSPGVPTVVTIASPVVAEPAAVPGVEDGTEAPAGADDAAAVDPAEPVPPQGPIQIEGFVAVPIDVTVVGPYANTMAFLERMQTGLTRLYLVTALIGVRQQTADATGGRPPTTDGDLELAISGYVYVLTNDLLESVASSATDPGDEPAPMPGSDRNPFIPLVSSVAVA